MLERIDVQWCVECDLRNRSLPFKPEVVPSFDAVRVELVNLGSHLGKEARDVG